MPVEIRKRDMKLSDHNISRDKYNELKYFCLQYWQKKQEIDRNYGIDGFSQDGMPRGTSSSNPTEKKALRIAQLKRDTELIEQTAMEADAEIYPWILKNVTSGVPYEYMDVPIQWHLPGDCCRSRNQNSTKTARLPCCSTLKTRKRGKRSINL